MPEQQWIFAHILYPRIIFIIIIKRIKSRGGRHCCTIPIRVSWLWENCNSNNSVGTSLLYRSFADGRCRYLIINNHTTRRMGMGGISPPPQASKCWSGYLCCYGNAFSIFSVWLNWSSPQAKKLLFYLTPILVVLIILLLDCTILPDWSSSWVDDIQWMFTPSTLTHYSGYSHFFLLAVYYDECRRECYFYFIFRS